MILCSNPLAQYKAYQDEIDEAIHRVLESGSYILGEEVRHFESEYAKYLGAKHCWGVANGTDALHIALTACGVGPGDEVITVSHTAVATVSAIRMCQAKPVFVDIDKSTYTMDTSLLSSMITERTKAIIPVHIYGHPANLDEICRIAKLNNLYVIEDCAQAHGAKYRERLVGTIGDISCFSFYPTKNLGALGDGGAVVTDNQVLSEKIYSLREYGWQERFKSEINGWNSRLDELQAAILRVKLKYLTVTNEARISLAKTYTENLNSDVFTLPVSQNHCKHVYHLFVIRTQNRDRWFKYLRSKNIGVSIHYPYPVHKQPAYLEFSCELPETEKTCEEILSLPLYPELGERINYIIQTINNEAAKLGN